MAQTSAVWIQAAHQTNYMVNRSHTKKKKKKSLSLNKKRLENFLEWKKKKKENGPVVEKTDWTERTGLGRRITEEIGGGTQMTALRFQTGAFIIHPWPPFEGRKEGEQLPVKTPL